MRVPPFRLHVFVVLYEHSKAYAGLPVAVIAHCMETDHLGLEVALRQSWRLPCEWRDQRASGKQDESFHREGLLDTWTLTTDFVTRQ
jgi:hypothetical protein